MDQVYIKVSDKVRVICEETAKELCKERGMKLEGFNQDLNAVCAARVLVKLGVPAEKVRNQSVLEALKVMGNTSALRQKISGAKTAAGTEAVVLDLANLVK